jgi:FkbM family methyltransferase
VAVKDLMKAGLSWLGRGISRIPPPHSLAHQVGNFIRKHQINLVLDVGAFRGAYCQMLRQEARYDGRIVSFEPCAESFKILSARMAEDRNWRGYPYGLSNTDSAAKLNTYGERGDFNSLLRLREQDASVYQVDTINASTEAVRLFKIDTLWAELTIGLQSPRVFLKIDTQGHDTSVVLGAAGHFDFIYGIQSELPAVEIYDGMTSMPDALKLYGSLGYVPVGFFPVNTPEAYGVPPEFDVLLKRFTR